eukprot:349776-Chlamydomonas_euryale.AAC.1
MNYLWGLPSLSNRPQLPPAALSAVGALHTSPSTTLVTSAPTAMCVCAALASACGPSPHRYHTPTCACPSTSPARTADDTWRQGGQPGRHV